MPTPPPPSDPIEQLLWINDRISALTARRRRALFYARLHGRLAEAITASGLSRKKVLAETRAENNASGRMVRWNSIDS